MGPHDEDLFITYLSRDIYIVNNDEYDYKKKVSKGGWKYYLVADANNISYSQYSYGFNNVYELCEIIDDCQLLARILCNINNY